MSTEQPALTATIPSDPHTLTRRIFARSLLLAAVILSLGLLIGPYDFLGREDATPKDAGLVLSSLAHAVLGLGLTIAHWLAGAGLVAALSGRANLSLTATLLIGFPVGLLVAAVLSVIALKLPFGGVVALAICAGSIVFLRKSFILSTDGRHIFGVFLQFCLVAIVYGAWIGLLKHGPTALIESRPPGDLAFYASAISSINAHVLPAWDWTIEGQSLNGFNMLFPTLGAAAMKWLPVDPFLFLGAGGGAAFLLTAAGTVHLYAREAGGDLFQPRYTLLNSWLIWLAVLTSSYGPIWNFDSIPMVHLVATTVSSWFLIRRAMSDPRWLPPAVTSAVLGPALSKVVAGIVLIPLAVLTIPPLLRNASPRTAVTAAGFAILGLGYATSMFFNFGGWALATHSPGPFSWTYYQCCNVLLLGGALRDVSTLLLIITALLALRSVQGVVLAGTLLIGLIYPIVVFAALLSSALILTFMICESRVLGNSWRLVILLAFICAAYKAIYEDSAGPIAALTLVIGIGPAIWIAVQEAAVVQPRSEFTAPHLRFMDARQVLLPVLVLGCFSLATAALGKIRLDTGNWKPASTWPGLSPETYDIWRAVRRMTPPEALIFTDSVSEVSTLMGGWNTYAAQGGRQLFISQWVQSANPNPHAGITKDRLDQNIAVFEGRLRPREIRTVRSFTAFFAVAGTSRAMSANWQPVYGNGAYVLYLWREPAN